MCPCTSEVRTLNLAPCVPHMGLMVLLSRDTLGGGTRCDPCMWRVFSDAGSFPSSLLSISIVLPSPLPVPTPTLSLCPLLSTPWPTHTTQEAALRPHRPGPGPRARAQGHKASLLPVGSAGKHTL